ncbi:MAG: cytochrome bc complex cytochrome b subunit, partial [Burkholderiaceae bacterium]
KLDAAGHPLDAIPSHPYYTFHDLFGVTVFLLIFSTIIFFAPEMGGYFLEYNNFIPANPLQTPPHIAPVWYFTPYYSVLRATTSQFMYALVLGVIGYVALIWFKTKLKPTIKLAAVAIGALAILAMGALGMVADLLHIKVGIPEIYGFDAKFFGVVLMGVSVMILAALPWIDMSPVKSIRYRPSWHKYVYIVFGIAFLILGYLGVLPPTAGRTFVAQICTFIYFGFFMLMPWWSAMGTFKPVPDRVTFHPH